MAGMGQLYTDGPEPAAIWSRPSMAARGGGGRKSYAMLPRQDGLKARAWRRARSKPIAGSPLPPCGAEGPERTAAQEALAQPSLKKLALREPADHGYDGGALAAAAADSARVDAR